MKRTRLQRKSELRAKTPLKRTGFTTRSGLGLPDSSNPEDVDTSGSSRREWGLLAGQNRAKQRKPMKRGGRVKPVSPKRAKENRERRVVVQGMAATDPSCRLRIPGICTGAADDCDEIVRRSQGGSITDEANLQLACRSCHRFKTENPQWAVDSGLARWGMRTNPDGEVA